MTTDEAVKHFGSQQALARAIGCKQPAISQWGERPPMLRQYQIQLLTDGALMADAQPEVTSKD